MGECAILLQRYLSFKVERNALKKVAVHLPGNEGNAGMPSTPQAR